MSWSQAYAKQARSDLQAREHILSNDRLPGCHHLHYLQMAAEKLCKAHLSAQGQGQEVLETGHGFIAGPLPVIARQILARTAGAMPRNPWVLDAIRKLARQIEKLHPQVDDAGRAPSNCVYPWVGADGEVVAPADHPFDLTLLHEKAGTTLLRIMSAAADELITQG